MPIIHQVAVLCQFLEEVDYGTAFKALQERNSYDAMDTYYHLYLGHQYSRVSSPYPLYNTICSLFRIYIA